MERLSNILVTKYVHQVSISSMFYVHIFCTNIFGQLFSRVTWNMKKLPKRLSYVKLARKTLIKLSTVSFFWSWAIILVVEVQNIYLIIEWTDDTLRSIKSQLEKSILFKKGHLLYSQCNLFHFWKTNSLIFKRSWTIVWAFELRKWDETS